MRIFLKIVFSVIFVGAFAAGMALLFHQHDVPKPRPAPYAWEFNYQKQETGRLNPMFFDARRIQIWPEQIGRKSEEK